MTTISNLKSKTFCKTEFEMFKQLDEINEKERKWELEYMSIDKLYKNNKEYINKLSI